MNKHTVVQGFEPKPEGGDEPYWMVLAESGLVMEVFDTEQEAVNHAKLLNNPPTPAPVDILKAKNAEIAELKAEVARLLSGMQETLNVVQEYQKVAIHPSDVGMFKHIANTLVRSMLEQPHPAPVQEAVTLTDEPVMDEDVIRIAKHQADNLSAKRLRQMESGRVLIERGSIFQAPKYSAGDLVFYYGDVMVIQSSDLINGVYAYELQRLDNGDILGAMIAESELDPA